MAACTLAVASFSCIPSAGWTPDPLECRSSSISSPVRCMIEYNAEVLTGHEDGCIRFWTAAGDAILLADGKKIQKTIKMHNTAVTCLTSMPLEGVWSCSSAGSVRKMSASCSRTSTECRAPGKRSAHSTEVLAIS